MTVEDMILTLPPSKADLLDMEPAPSTAEIKSYATDHNILILAHSYQEGEIQDAAHFVGDSLELARKAAEEKPDKICFCGVHFMAETAKILNPESSVFMPDPEAGCSLAEGCKAEDLAKYQTHLKQKLGRDDLVTVCYINTTAAVKALCDYVCTSGNSLEVIDSIPEESPILFVPDVHLGGWVQEQRPDRNIQLWNASCIVHELFSIETLLDIRREHPDSIVLAHPECPKNIRDEADYVRGTAGMLRIVTADQGKTYIVATEGNMIHRFRADAPDNEYIPAPGASCACNLCPHMQRTTADKLWRSLQTEEFEISVPQNVASQARVAVDRMLATRPKPDMEISD
jgi:quinolinate synthase